MSNKRHILILTNSFPNRYQPLAGIFWKEQAEAMVKMGFEISVIAVVPISWRDIIRQRKLFYVLKGEFNGVLTDLVCYPGIPFFHFIQSYITKWLGFRRFMRLCQKKRKPEIVHVHRYEAGLLALKIKSLNNIPFIVTEHSSRFLKNQLGGFESRIARSVFKGANERVSVSNNLQHALSDMFNLNFQIIPNAVDTEFFNFDQSIKRNEDEFIILNAGNFTVNKNIPMLIEAFNKFQKNNSHVRLILAGDGPLKKASMDLVNKLELSKKIEFTGRLDRDEMKKLYAKSDIYVLSSSKETFGAVVLEALSMGVPVISTKCGGPESLLVDSKFGELCEISSIALFKALQNQFLKIKEYDKNSIRKDIINNFDQKIIVNRYSELYSIAIGKKN